MNKQKEIQHLITIGQQLFTAGHIAKAEQHYRKVLLLQPFHPEALFGLALIANKTGHTDAAIKLYSQVICQAPNHPEVCNNLAEAYMKKGNFVEAIKLFDRVLEQCPDHGVALYNRVVAGIDGGMPATSIEPAKRLQKIAPDNHNNTYHLALAQLSLGILSEGWDNYSARWGCKGGLTNWGKMWRQYPQPVWKGEDLGGKTLLVWGEQGIGDEIIYSTMLADLSTRKDMHVLLEIEPRLVAIYQRTYPDFEVIPRHNPPLPRVHESDIVAQSPVASLGCVFRRQLDDFPKHPNPILPDPELRQRLREKYQAAAPGNLLVGISWKSKNAMGSQKSAPLEQWKPILTQPGFTFVNVQYGDVKAEIDAANDKLGTQIIYDPEVDPISNMDASFAQIGAMDYIISTSNSTVHTAGVMNIPGYIMLPAGKLRLWYWFRQRQDSPWYPSLTLYEAEKLNQWTHLIQIIAGHLQQINTDRQQA